jgi:N-carbamoylputrescine amidase
MGADVIFMPHASPRGTPTQKFNSWMRHLPARAFDNSLYVVACNQNPSGRIVKKNTGGKEHMIVADLKAEELEKVRGHRMRYFLPNRRPDLY